MAALDILYRDEHLIAIDKPAGLLVHRSDIDRHETRIALQLLRDQIGHRVFPVHRLDKPASGPLLFALSPQAARRMGEAFAGGQVRKTYLAIVRGYPPASGVIDHPLRERYDPLSGKVPEEGNSARAAVTTYRRLATAELAVRVDRYPTSRYSLVEARPATGRRHQLRRHFKHVAHPIIGDTTYGKGSHNRLFAERFGCSRLLLAAVALEFMHPWSGALCTIGAPLDAAFAGVVRALGWAAGLPTPALRP